MPQFTEMRRPALWDELEESSQHRASPRTVVVGYDGSDASRRALLRAVDAAGDGGHVQVVTAGEPPQGHAFEPGVTPDADAPARLLDEATAFLDGKNVTFSTLLEEADPADALAAAARRLDAALIVVGARGGSFLARTVRGSVAEKLIARAPCDLLVAR